MFSRPGKATTAEYLAFKEPLPEPIPEEDRLEASMPEEVKKNQLIADLKGENKDAFAQYMDAKVH